jgi:hypothetical protein
MDLWNSFVDTCFYTKWSLPFMKEEREKLIEKERILYHAVWDKMGQAHNNKYPHLSTQLNVGHMSDMAFELHETRSQESWTKYVKTARYEEYKLNKDKYIEAYNNIIEICDKTIKIIQDLCDKNGYDSIKADMINNYTSVKETSNAVDISSFYGDHDWIYRTMPLIRILHIEYVKVLDYQRLVTFQQKANLTEEEAISIINYLISKNLTSFYFKMDKYPENTLLVKKVMNRFSKEHDIRPEDTLEVFQEYIGNGEESKRIMKHEIITYC